MTLKSISVKGLDTLSDESKLLDPIGAADPATLPPETVTSYVEASTVATFVTVAVVVPLTAKSTSSTFCTSSSKLARNTSESASVLPGGGQKLGRLGPLGR